MQGGVEAGANLEGPLCPERPCVSGLLLMTSSWVGSPIMAPGRKCYHKEWKIVQRYVKNFTVNAAIEDVRIKYEQVYIIHYMDDILIAHPDRAHLQTVLHELTQALSTHGLGIASEKIQINPPITYLGRIIHPDTVTHAPM